MAAVASINVTLFEMGFVYRLNNGPKLSRLPSLKEKRRKIGLGLWVINPGYMSIIYAYIKIIISLSLIFSFSRERDFNFKNQSTNLQSLLIAKATLTRRFISIFVTRIFHEI